MKGMLSTLVKNRVWAMGCWSGMRLISRLLTARRAPPERRQGGPVYLGRAQHDEHSDEAEQRRQHLLARECLPASQTASGTISSGAA